MDYNISSDFKTVPVGAFVNANKKTAWPAGNGCDGVNQDFDTSGQRFSIVADDRFGGQATRCCYPQGKYGMNDQSYQIMFKSPCNVANLEFDWLFEDGFDFFTPNDGKVGGGKIGPCIQWGPVGGNDAVTPRGTRCMIWWNVHGSNYPNPVFSPSCQDQATGNQLIQPVKYSAKIETNRLYHFKITVRAGENGFARYELDGELFAEVKGKYMKVAPEDHVYSDFAYFSGGASPSYAPRWDSFGRCGNVRAWSTIEGGGTPPVDPPIDPPIDPPVDPTPEPTPDPVPTSAFSIAVGEMKVLDATFFDDKVFPPKQIEPGGAVKWSASPSNALTWGEGLDPNYRQIKVTGKTPAQGAVAIATDPVSGISTAPMVFDVTASPRQAQIRAGELVLRPDDGAANLAAAGGALQAALDAFRYSTTREHADALTAAIAAAFLARQLTAKARDYLLLEIGFWLTPAGE